MFTLFHVQNHVKTPISVIYGLEMMLAPELKDVSLQALHLIVGRYLQPFEGVYKIGTL